MTRKFAIGSLAPIFLWITLLSTLSFGGEEPRRRVVAPYDPELAHPVYVVEWTDPQRVHSVRPKYPRKARRAKIEADVILQVLIHQDGTVGDARVIKGPGGGLGFEAAALDAVWEWRYRPALENGDPVGVYYTVIVNFRLKNK